MERQLKRLTGIFLAMALMIVIGVTITFLSGQAVISNEREVIARLNSIDDLRNLGKTLRDAESGERGFLYTGDEKYLEPYKDAKSIIGERLEQVDALVRDGHISAGDTGQIHQLAQERLDELDRAIDLWRKQGPEAAKEVVRTNQGLATMEKLSALISTIVDQQHQIVVQREKTVEWSTALRNILFSVVALSNLIFIGWVYRRVSMEMHARDRALAAVQEQRELLAVTLRSIGDAVIVTDTLGAVTFINEVAQQLTGFSEPQAHGLPIAQVFNIISEETRLPVESPVQKVLREGMVVGLANHTLLVRPDGTEVPIDDSGAPVRDRYGRVHGVVLVFRDFSEYKRHESAIQEARRAAERASQAKDQFMAALSHELRTPLTPVLAMLTTWEDDREIPEQYKSDLQMMRRNVELEARLIDDLLDLTRVVKGKLTINVERADVHDILRHVQQTCKSEANARHIHVVMDLAAKHHHVMADSARLQQIFWNILRNATKFSNETGEVIVATADTPAGMMEISFTDHGIGMEQQTLDKLFRPFEQGGPAITRRFGGLGLGLAISKALVDIQGGTLAAESAGLGKGARFKVQLPPALPAPAETGAAPEQQTRLPKPVKKLRILLVEDHADTAKTMARLLSNLGHHVQTAGTVADALNIARHHNPDLILSDIGLPDGDGVELLSQLRQFTNAPAIALTGFGMDEDIARTAAAGFRAHITKPVNFQRLQMMVHQVAMTPQPDGQTQNPNTTKSV
jgi:PAS domain S-box-containing protein